MIEKELFSHYSIDEKKLLAARNGTANRAWVEKSLEAKGYEIIDDVYEP